MLVVFPGIGRGKQLSGLLVRLGCRGFIWVRRPRMTFVTRLGAGVHDLLGPDVVQGPSPEEPERAEVRRDERPAGDHEDRDAGEEEERHTNDVRGMPNRHMGLPETHELRELARGCARDEPRPHAPGSVRACVWALRARDIQR